MTPQQFMRLLEAFCEKTGYAPGTVCLRAGVAPQLYDRLSKGGDCHADTKTTVILYMEANKHIRNPRARKKAVAA